jgi:hypothetical protein
MTMLTDAKTLIGSPVTVSGDYDGLLEDILAGILAEADEFMGVAYQEVEDQEDWFDGGVRTLYLSHVNVSAVVVEVDGVILTSDQFTVYPEAGKIRYGLNVLSGFATASEGSGGKFSAGQRNVKVTYDGGYAEASYPASLRRKLLKQVSYEFRRRNDPGLTAVSYPEGSVQKYTIAEWLSDVEAELLRRRRIIL